MCCMTSSQPSPHSSIHPYGAVPFFQTQFFFPFLLFSFFFSLVSVPPRLFVILSVQEHPARAYSCSSQHVPIFCFLKMSCMSYVFQGPEAHCTQVVALLVSLQNMVFHSMYRYYSDETFTRHCRERSCFNLYGLLSSRVSFSRGGILPNPLVSRTAAVERTVCLGGGGVDIGFTKKRKRQTRQPGQRKLHPVLL